MIQPIPPAGEPHSNPGVNRTTSPPMEVSHEHEGEFDKAMEDIALRVAKEFWSEQEIKN